jgi:hypothetical protein
LSLPDPLARRSAFAEAQKDHELSLALIERALGSARATPLSPEQVLQLDRLAFDRFCSEPRAAMGVQFDQTDRISDGARISAPLDHFDSKRVLQPGDIIHEIDGVVIHRQEQMRAAIVSHTPGDEVSLRVERQGEQLSLRLKMGSFADLDQANAGVGPMPRRGNMQGGGMVNRNALDSQTLSKAWSVRCERNRIGLASLVSTLDSGIRDDHWDSGEPTSSLELMARVSKARGAALAAQGQGGQWAQGFAGQGAVQMLQANREARLRAPERTDGLIDAEPAGGDQVLFNTPPAIFTAGQLGLEMGERANKISVEIQSLRSRIRVQQGALGQRVLAPEERRKIDQQISLLQQRIDQLEAALAKEAPLEP